MSATFFSDVQHTAVLLESIVPQSVTTGTVTGSGCDMQTSDGPITLVLQYGAIAGSYNPLQVTVQESTDNSTGWTTVTSPSSDAATSLLVGLANTVELVGNWHRSKRYVRAQLVATGGTTALVSASFLARKKITGSGAGNSLLPTTA